MSLYQTLNLKNQSILITGASSGIGKSCANFFGQMGLKLRLVSRRIDVLESLVSSYGGEFIAGDINDKETLKQMEQKGFFDSDILINNAGLALGKDDFYALSDEDMEVVLNTNVTSAFKIAKRSLAKMKERQSGDIVNICSIASHEAYKGGGVYCASKFALRALGKSLREETYGENIRIITVSPGLVETNFSNVRFCGDKDKAKATYHGMIPLRPEDIAWQISNALMAPRHVNVDEIIILATDQAGANRVRRNKSVQS